MPGLARFDGRIAFVTGGGGNIGSACARRLATEGAAVALIDIDADGAARAAQAITAAGGRAVALTADLRGREAVRAALDEAAALLGPPDVLVNSVGVFASVDVVDVTDADWDRVMDANLRSPFLTCQEVVRTWQAAGRAGSIVNIASIESIVPFPRQLHYAASKGGVAMMTRALALDLAMAGIRVNAVGPGTIPRPGREQTAWEELGEQYPLGRLGTGEDVAAAVAFLASDDAAWVTGQTLYVEGGRLIR